MGLARKLGCLGSVVALAVVALAVVTPGCSLPTGVLTPGSDTGDGMSDAFVSGMDVGPRPDTGVDAGPGVDVGPGVDSGVDAFVVPVDSGMDAFVVPVDTGVDAFTPPVDMGMDAFTPPVDMGMDAFTPPVDMGNDAFTPPPDMGNDAFVPPPDMGNDAFTPPRSCTALFGSTSGFILCSETATTCEFYVNLGGSRSCDDACGAVSGSSCTAARNNGGTGTRCMGGTVGSDTCSSTHMDELCTCARVP